MKLRLGLLLFLLYPLFLSYSQSGRSYRISSILYQIDGTVRESALNAILDWNYQTVFKNRWELETYLREKKQILINRKAFTAVSVDYRVVGEDQGISNAEVIMKLSTAWPIYPIPIYKYDSNFGLVTGLGTTYYNFIGTLTNLSLLGYYSPGKSEISTRLEGVRIGSFVFDVGVSQLWEEVKAVDEEGDINLRYNYAKTIFDISFQLHLMENLDYIVTPTLTFPFSYNFELNDTDKDNSFYTSSGATPSFSHLLLYDRVNWIGNLRQGFSFSLENGIDYQAEDNSYMVWVDGILTTFVYTPVMNYNSRISSFYFNGGYRENAGDRIRGVLDYKLTGNWGFFWNQNFVIPLVKIPAVMDFHLSPFFDMGFVGDTKNIFQRDEVIYTAGVSLSVFPAPLPNIQLSLDYGINIQESNEQEILISSILYF